MIILLTLANALRSSEVGLNPGRIPWINASPEMRTILHLTQTNKETRCKLKKSVTFMNKTESYALVSGLYDLNGLTMVMQTCCYPKQVYCSPCSPSKSMQQLLISTKHKVQLRLFCRYLINQSIGKIKMLVENNKLRVSKTIHPEGNIHV